MLQNLRSMKLVGEHNDTVTVRPETPLTEVKTGVSKLIAFGDCRQVGWVHFQPFGLERYNSTNVSPISGGSFRRKHHFSPSGVSVNWSRPELPLLQTRDSEFAILFDNMRRGLHVYERVARIDIPGWDCKEVFEADNQKSSVSWSLLGSDETLRSDRDVVLTGKTSYRFNFEHHFGPSMYCKVYSDNWTLSAKVGRKVRDDGDERFNTIGGGEGLLQAPRSWRHAVGFEKVGTATLINKTILCVPVISKAGGHFSVYEYVGTPDE